MLFINSNGHAFAVCPRLPFSQFIQTTDPHSIHDGVLRFYVCPVSCLSMPSGIQWYVSLGRGMPRRQRQALAWFDRASSSSIDRPAAHLPPPFFTRFLSLVLFPSFQSPGSVSKVRSRTAPVRSATDNGGVRRAAPPTTMDYFDRSSSVERRALTLVFLSSFHSRSSLR